MEIRSLPFIAAASGMVLGVVAWLLGADDLAVLAWIAATVSALVPATVETVRDLLARRPGVDVVALIAMVGALLLEEYFAGAVIALMLTGGESLERYATARAYRDLAALLERRPVEAHRELPDGSVEEIPVEEAVLGDVLRVRIGEVIPVDGIVLTGPAILDESALTGESRPVQVPAGDAVRSGAVNTGGPFRIRAIATSGASTYESIIRLVRDAETSRPRFVRLADRYAGWFAPLALAVAGLAWAATGDPVRGLAVVVVATPCPLILAAPAAIVSGVSRAARDGVIVKGGAGLEALARARIALLDKTGTITLGAPVVERVVTSAGVSETELLRAAGALDQVSVHPFAPAIVRAARDADGRELPFPSGVHEELGSGITGTVGGTDVRLGRASFVAGDSVPRELAETVERAEAAGSSAVHVALDGRPTGVIVLIDPIDESSAAAVSDLRELGISRVVMLTGDDERVARRVAERIGVDDVLAERSPEGKVEAVREARALGPTLVAGDGVNDAPALALADVGVAMGARGATAASEAADVVVVAGRLDGVVRAVTIAQRSERIAKQSAIGGMGLAAVAMVFAAFGYVPPAAGAVVQEVIDLGVILNALRALRIPVSTSGDRASGDPVQVAA